MQATHRLERWRFPTLDTNRFGCSITNRIASKNLATQLDLTVQQLSTRFTVPMQFHGGKSIDNVGESRAYPERKAFPSDAAFDAAEGVFHDTYVFMPKPWWPCGQLDVAGVRAGALDFLRWSINDKCYVVNTEEGETKEVAFSRKEKEKRQIATQEKAFGQSRQDFIDELVLFLGRSTIEVFESDHLLDIESVEANGWICFYDEVVAYVTEQRIIVLWAGRDGFYG